MPPRPLASAPTESVINLLDANTTGSLSVSDLSQQRMLSGGYSIETVTQGLQEAHSEIVYLKRLVQELTAKRGAVVQGEPLARPAIAAPAGPGSVLPEALSSTPRVTGPLRRTTSFHPHLIGTGT
ncbi:hypothetical protein BKA70DRAFT_1241106 [Coprinopsis sp. MPI-PUGE-AT-0042]|nr:hypothetical protein BKA70DRAFT_1241106 [Coprinopsis sp. MPI-PUGE-AT-0042]